MVTDPAIFKSALHVGVSRVINCPRDDVVARQWPDSLQVILQRNVGEASLPNMLAGCRRLHARSLLTLLDMGGGQGNSILVLV